MRVDCCLLHFSNHLFILISRYQYLLLHFTHFNFHCSKKMQNNPLSSTDSDIIYVEKSSTELSAQKNNSSEKLNSTELSRATALEHTFLSSVESPEPQLITIDLDSSEPTLPNGFGGKDPIVSPSLNDLNLPANPFNILATMELVQPSAANHGHNYSPQSPEPSEPSCISTHPMNLSTIEGWETPHKTRRVAKEDLSPTIKLVSSTATPQGETKNEIWNVFPRKKVKVAPRL